MSNYADKMLVITRAEYDALREINDMPRTKPIVWFALGSYFGICTMILAHTFL